MKTFSIYGVQYSLQKTTSTPPEQYAYKDDLYDKTPPGRFVGYVNLDGTTIACYAKFNLLFVVIPAVVLLLTLLGILLYYYIVQPKDFNILGITIKQGTDNQVVQYEGFIDAVGNEATVHFKNGKYTSQIMIVGEGIQSEVITVGPDEEVDKIKVKVTSEDGIINAQLRIKTNTSEQSFPVVVENGNVSLSNDQLEGESGYWDKEEIYVIDIPE